MKQFFTLIILALAIQTSAQDGPDAADSAITRVPSYTEIADSALRFLNKSRVPQGILYDRVFPYASIPDLAAGDTIGTGYFLQAFSELQRASYTAPGNDDSAFTYRNARNIIVGENLLHRLPFFVL